jgi:hypothetical protein
VLEKGGREWLLQVYEAERERERERQRRESVAPPGLRG